MTDKPSKSALKRRYHELQALGEALIKLPKEQLQRMPLDEDLYAAIVTAAQMSARGALRRQRQLIGKMMRNVDDEPIRLALAAATRPEQISNQQFHRAEQWRDRIVADGQQALAEFPPTDETTVAELTDLAVKLRRCHSDADRRRLGRQLFRCVYRAFEPDAQNPDEPEPDVHKSAP